MLPRGLRNNNPGNLEKGENWKGLSKDQKDTRFCTFSSMTYGCRALIKLLVTYINKYECNTIEYIISKYAPSNENNTQAYINAVASDLGISPKQVITADGETLVKLAKAIAKHENGSIAETIITDKTWKEAANLAGYSYE